MNLTIMDKGDEAGRRFAAYKESSAEVASGTGGGTYTEVAVKLSRQQAEEVCRWLEMQLYGVWLKPCPKEDT